MPSTPVVADYAKLLVRHPLRWLAPAVLAAVGVAAFAFAKADVWEASLALIVRAEAHGNQGGAGRFRDLSEMKTLEETVLEIVKNRSVLTEALRKVGPAGNAAEAWPSGKDVDDLAESVAVAPPKGTEFGSTEVFYLRVKDHSPQRAVALADAVADEAIARFQTLRSDKARSMVAELQESADIARADLNQAVAVLGKFEAGVGGDLAELRNLEQLGSGDNDLRKLAVELESEVRQAETSERSIRELHEMLVAAQADPTRLLATPNRLLESQPALRRLKEGLIDAQIRTSNLRGGMSREHPLVQAALTAEVEIRGHLHDELTAAVAGVAAELRLADELLADRRAKLAAARGRLDRLASLRAEYSSLNAQMQSRMRRLEDAERQLSDARAAQAGGAAAGLLARIDAPDAGTRPVGPGKTVLLAGGIVGGFVVGIGCLFLTTTPAARAAEGMPAEVSRAVMRDWVGAERLPPATVEPLDELQHCGESRAANLVAARTATSSDPVSIV